MSDMTRHCKAQPWGQSYSIAALPDDVIYLIARHCDRPTLARLARVCRRFARLLRHDSVWMGLKKSLTIVCDTRFNKRRHFRPLSVKEQCRLALNWKNGHFNDIRLLSHRIFQMPCLQLDGPLLWVSYNNLIRCYRQRQDGYLQLLHNETLQAGGADVCRFVCKKDVIVAGYRDGSVSCFDARSNQPLWYGARCHNTDAQAVDLSENSLVSGSRDSTVKIWSMDMGVGSGQLCHTIEVEDRVWSLAANPGNRTIAVGTAGIKNSLPLRIWDIQTGKSLGSLGTEYRHAAGVLDVQYESTHVVMSCGYDTFVRMWDLRTPWTTCVKKWEEPFDSTIYCVRSDGNHAIVCGTARYGMVRLWDKRLRQSVKLYYSGIQSSPVYSLTFDASHLYLGLDLGIHMLDFSIR